MYVPVNPTKFPNNKSIPFLHKRQVTRAWCRVTWRIDFEFNFEFIILSFRWVDWYIKLHRLYILGLPETAVDSDDEDDEESCPSHDSFQELRDNVRECLEKEPADRNSDDISVLMVSR